MQEYYFLFVLALIWTIFATIQDLRSREVANWLNFSLIAFALAYRAFYAIQNNNAQFFLLGIAGFGIFFGLAHAFYYTKIFAGGDAKLLMSYGIILPYTNYFSLITISLAFILLLLSTGALYSIFYSLFIVSKHKQRFRLEFKKRFAKHRSLLNTSLLIFLLSLIFGTLHPIIFIFSPLFLIPILFVYTKALDKCMLVLLPPNKLTEGDWIEKDIKVSPSKIIKKTVHGLSKKDIALLKKYNKKVLVKEGIPFVPAFLIALIIMALFFSTSEPSSLFSFLSLFFLPSVS
jgi:Flp pilus assembly protein protease CpaA